MDDYSELAQRISVGVTGVSGALILSRDGLVLGAHPDEGEGLAKQAWLRFSSLGEPDRSFVEFPDQVWAYVKRGPYAAFATAQGGTRPGVLVDQIEQVLYLAEEGRARRDTLRVPDSNAAPSSKPRTSLHPQPERAAPAEVAASAAEAIRATADEVPPRRGPFTKAPAVRVAAGDAPDVVEPAVVEPDEQPETGSTPAAERAAPGPETVSSPPERPQRLAGTGAGSGFDDDAEVDRVLLAKEFSGLLQVDSSDDEGSS
jgi:hypothetical protein